MHSFSNQKSLEPAIINTIASTGDGIYDLCVLIKIQKNIMKHNGIFDSKRLERHRNRIRGLIQDRLLEEFWNSRRLDLLKKNTQDIESIQSSPYEIAEKILDSINHG